MTRSRRTMPTPARGATLPLIALLALVSGALLAAPVIAHDGIEDHAHVAISLGDSTDTSVAEKDDVLRFAYHGARSVAGGALRIPVPQQGVLISFEVPGADGNTNMETNSTGRVAVFTYTDSPPPDGTIVHNVSVLITQIVDPTSDVTVDWGPFYIDELTVRVEIPSDHTIVSFGTLVPQTHAAPEDRRVWHNLDYPRENMSFTIRPAFRGTDPAFSDPPGALTGFVILIAIGIVSGAVWVGTKKLERLAESKKGT